MHLELSTRTFMPSPCLSWGKCVRQKRLAVGRFENRCGRNHLLPDPQTLRADSDDETLDQQPLGQLDVTHYVRPELGGGPLALIGQGRNKLLGGEGEQRSLG